MIKAGVVRRWVCDEAAKQLDRINAAVKLAFGELYLTTQQPLFKLRRAGDSRAAALNH